MEIIDIECGLLSRASQKISGFIRANRTFCAKANGNF